jgi:hypothetical protein
MKGLKLSKISWLILSAGVFIVVLAGLGLTRSQQMKEQTKVADTLELAKKRLGTVQTAPLSQQLDSLKAKVEESQALLKDAQAKLRQTVISVDVTDEFFQIAQYCSVNVTNLNTTTIAQSKYEGVTFSTISLAATVTGEETNIIKFIVSLNNGYLTGNVESAQITFPGVPEESGASESGGESGGESGEGETTTSGETRATVNMLIYSYEGK